MKTRIPSLAAGVALLLALLATSAEAAGSSHFVLNTAGMTKQRLIATQAVDLMTGQVIQVPGSLLPSVSVYTDGFNAVLSTSVPLPPKGSAVTFDNRVQILSGRDAKSLAEIRDIKTSQDTTKDRWWFDAQEMDKVEVYRDLGQSIAPGEWVVRVNVFYTVYDVLKLAVYYDFQVRFRSIAFRAYPCLGGDGNVNLEFSVKTLFPVPESTDLSWQVDGWGSGNDTLTANTGSSSEDYPLYAVGFLASAQDYDDELTTGTQHVAVEILGSRATTEQAFYGPSGGLSRCGLQGGGKGATSR